MKNIHEMTHKEVVALSREDIETLVEISCAEKGIKILPHPEKHPVLTPSKDLKLIQLFSVYGLKFGNRESAEVVQSCLKTVVDKLIKTDYVSTPVEDVYDCLCPDQQKDIRIKEVAAIRPDDLYIVREVAELNKEQEKEYQALCDLFNESREEIRKISEPIYAIYDKQISIQTRIWEMEQALDKFMILADGKEDIALRFFANCYSKEYAPIKEYFDAKEYLKTKLEELNANSKDNNPG